jgi:hypothetical protein
MYPFYVISIWLKFRSSYYTCYTRSITSDHQWVERSHRIWTFVRLTWFVPKIQEKYPFQDYFWKKHLLLAIFEQPAPCKKHPPFTRCCFRTCVPTSRPTDPHPREHTCHRGDIRACMNYSLCIDLRVSLSLFCNGGSCSKLDFAFAFDVLDIDLLTY